MRNDAEGRVWCLDSPSMTLEVLSFQNFAKNISVKGTTRLEEFHKLNFFMAQTVPLTEITRNPENQEPLKAIPEGIQTPYSSFFCASQFSNLFVCIYSFCLVIFLKNKNLIKWVIKLLPSFTCLLLINKN